MRKVSQKAEEYLETIYRMKEKGRRARTGEMARELGVSSASVSGMFKKLARDGLIRYTPYAGASLTKKGEEIGESITRKHRLLEKFLMFLGVRRAHHEACALEHGLSDRVEGVLQRAISAQKIKSDNLVRLSEMKEGSAGKVAFVMAGRGATQRLADMGMTKGAEVKVIRSSHYGGPVTVLIRGCSLAVGRGLASKVFVQVEG